MCVRRYLGFVLLVWFQGVLHVQTSDQPCSAPGLNGGYWVPEQDTYSHETKLTYACENGRKPAVEGWWVTSTCQNGTWSPKPQCIDEKACMPLTIPNAIYTVNTNGWYEENHIIRITCDKGYEYKQRDATAQCISGNWSSVPVCEKSVHACGEPPQIPHAVIIHQGYQDIFSADTILQYECEDGYTIDGADTKQPIYCIAGNWTDGPVCSRRTRPAGGTGGGHTTSAGSGTQPAGGSSGLGTVYGGSIRHETSAGSWTKPEWEVNNCGKHPIVPNAEVIENGQMFVRYQCSSFYEREGPEVVQCYSDGTWSNVPTCRATFCSVDTSKYPELINVGVQYMRDGEKVKLACGEEYKVVSDHYSVGWCTDGIISRSKCCGWLERKLHIC